MIRKIKLKNEKEMGTESNITIQKHVSLRRGRRKDMINISIRIKIIPRVALRIRDVSLFTLYMSSTMLNKVLAILLSPY
jgi:hypothetical protein